MSRAINFSAGPAALPLGVLEKAQSEFLDYNGTGMSVMEMSHRSSAFIEIANRAELDLRSLLGISEEFHVLFLQGGATAQFAALPLNLLGDKSKADYVDTGSWSQKAIKEASNYCDVHVASSSEYENYERILPAESWTVRSDAAYLHVCSNETIGGLQFKEFPSIGIPLVADMSSDILSREIDVDQFGLIYAGAQKNIGPAGLAIVIVKKSLCGKSKKGTPSILDYSLQAEADSMLNTPPTMTVYLAGQVFSWLCDLGGLSVIAKQNEAKAAKLYNIIDKSEFYLCPVEEPFRSFMNVPFRLRREELEGLFLDRAEENGMFGLKGHRSVGGVRASIYNAVEEKAVDALIAFMAEFAKENG